jgi:ubiquinone/menaquinone biosynthesis C-methylase UbiE
MNTEKRLVHDFWNRQSCGEELYLPDSEEAGFTTQAGARYTLEGEHILALAEFDEARGRRVLEIGVGLGADHQRFAEAGADLYGIDLTERAIKYTQRRLSCFGLESRLAVGDAENLEFPDDFFDLVYSWGVLHHTPDTPKAFEEVFRVLKRGGEARIMIYHKWSIVGLMLWMRYALLRLRPWLALDHIYANYLESPGTKAYTYSEARQMCSRFRDVKITTPLSHADLLESAVGQRHRGRVLALAGFLWPRWIIRRVFPSSGIFMMIQARK